MATMPMYHKHLYFSPVENHKLKFSYLGKDKYKVEGPAEVGFFVTGAIVVEDTIVDINELKEQLKEQYGQDVDNSIDNAITADKNYDKQETLIRESTATEGGCFWTDRHEGVKFLTQRGEETRIWYLGDDQYRIEGKARVIFNLQGRLEEASGVEVKNATVSLDELRRKEGLPPATTILVLTDALSLLHFVHGVLYRAGYIVHAVDSLIEAKNRLRRREFDIALLDYPLQDAGMEALIHEMKTGHPPIKIVAFLAESNLAQTPDVLALGASDILRKPFTEEELLAKFKEQLPFIK